MTSRRYEAWVALSKLHTLSPESRKLLKPFERSFVSGYEEPIVGYEYDEKVKGILDSVRLKLVRIGSKNEGED